MHGFQYKAWNPFWFKKIFMISQVFIFSEVNPNPSIIVANKCAMYFSEGDYIYIYNAVGQQTIAVR